MPLRLNVGASRKVTDNNYGSRGASVNLELELDSALIAEPAKLQEKIRHLFSMVRTSLAEELNGGNGHGAKPTPSAPPPVKSSPSGNGNGSPPRNGSVRAATPAQIKAIYGLAKRQGLNLAELLNERAQVRRPEELTLPQASLIIDAIKNAPV